MSTTCDPPTTIQFVLRATAGGPGYIGAFEAEAIGSNNIMDVTGAPQPDGSVIFSGTRGGIPGNSTTLELRRLLVRPDGAAGLTGDVDLWILSGSYKQHLSGSVLSASYQPLVSLPGQSVSGTWTGLAVIRACSGYCPLYQDPGDGVRISMVLGQNGGSLSGNVQFTVFSCGGCWLPITGSASGAQVSLSSPLVTRTSAYGDRTLHLESFDGTVDDLGRISGRFVYASDSRIAIAPFDVSYRLECEILWLKRD